MGPYSGRYAHGYWCIIDDLTLEGDETVQVRMDYTLANGAVGTHISNAFLIQDDDSATVSVSDSTVTEASGTAPVTVSVTITDDQTSGAGFSGWGGYGPGDRPAELAFPITVSYATSDNTAVADEDYGTSNGTLTFQGSVLSEIISIPIVIDDTDEQT